MKLGRRLAACCQSGTGRYGWMDGWTPLLHCALLRCCCAEGMHCMHEFWLSVCFYFGTDGGDITLSLLPPPVVVFSWPFDGPGVHVSCLNPALPRPRPCPVSCCCEGRDPGCLFHEPGQPDSGEVRVSLGERGWAKQSGASRRVRRRTEACNGCLSMPRSGYGLGLAWSC